MLFRLAALFGCPVRSVSKILSRDEIEEWTAYYLLEPWGGDFGKAAVGLLASLIENWSPKKIKGPWARPSDFFDDGNANKRPSRAQLKAKLIMFCGPTQSGRSTGRKRS